MGNVITPDEDQTQLLNESYYDNCLKAAEAIHQADYFLFTCGAGFSADSGLPTYQDIANVKAYNDQDLEYHHLCAPTVLLEDPDLFYGFWGDSLNAYRTAQPHEGYQILTKWKNEQFLKDLEFEQCWGLYDHFISSTESNLVEDQDISYDPNSAPGKFFVVSSNVDAHFHTAGFNRNEVEEIHGNIEMWHCSRPCGNKLWRVPAEFRFEVNKDTMLAEADDSSVGDNFAENNGFINNHPRCIECGCLARPSILMFYDTSYIEYTIPDKYRKAWKETVKHLIMNDQSKKLVIMEIGAGDLITTIRGKSERWFNSFGNQCTLIRINPDFPLFDDDNQPDQFIPLKGYGLDTLRKIDEHLSKLKESI
eukprot:TRINITY_DN2892_c0_g1_i3.p1 TRINITY_DN2892_c0_g1~~TRINITY_DN2892_c0_g1_i3.p1  ORF type:complete len:364 (+),score=71.12 TRINITY_DN2892_c0_g1_i3:79-1170(+)